MPEKKLIDIIEEEAKTKAAQIIADARKEYDKKIKETKQAEEKKLNEFKTKLKVKQELEVSKEIGEAKSKQRMQLLIEKHKKISNIQEMVRKQIKKDKRYISYLNEKINLALKQYPNSKIILSKEDKDIEKKLKIPKTKKVIYEDFFGGFKLYVINLNFEIDYTLDSKIKEVFENWSKKISDTLFR